MKPILNLAFLIILLLCAWSGYKKGLIMGVGGLLAIVVSLYGANLLSTTYSYEVIDALRPFASGYMETTINNKVRPEFGIEGAETGSLSVDDYLAQNPDQAESFCQSAFEYLGIYKSTAAQLAQESMNYSQTQEVGVTDAMVEVLCQRITYVAGLLLAFLLLLIILTVIGNLPNLSFKIPEMDLLNDVGGLVTGLLQGFCFCALIAWTLKFTGILLPQDKLADCFLVSGFMKMDLLSKLLGI